MANKAKTHSGAKKRFKSIGAKKGSTKKSFKHKQSHARHILAKKTTKRKRQLRGQKQVEACHEKVINKLLASHGNK